MYTTALLQVYKRTTMHCYNYGLHMQNLLTTNLYMTLIQCIWFYLQCEHTHVIHDSNNVPIPSSDPETNKPGSTGLNITDDTLFLYSWKDLIAFALFAFQTVIEPSPSPDIMYSRR